MIFGRGFGEVWSARSRKIHLICAAKRVNIIDDCLSVENEIAELKSFNSSCIVKYYGIEKNNEELWVCLVALRHD